MTPLEKINACISGAKLLLETAQDHIVAERKRHTMGTSDYKDNDVCILEEIEKGFHDDAGNYRVGTRKIVSHIDDLLVWIDGQIEDYELIRKGLA